MHKRKLKLKRNVVAVASIGLSLREKNNSLTFFSSVTHARTHALFSRFVAFSPFFRTGNKGFGISLVS